MVDAALALAGLVGFALVGLIAIAELSASFAGVAMCAILLLPAAVLLFRPSGVDTASLGLSGVIIIGLPPALVAFAVLVLIAHPFRGDGALLLRKSQLKTLSSSDQGSVK